MNRKAPPPISREQLNAFIDDELDFEEKARIFEQLGNDETLIRETQELQQLRSLLKHAYRNPPPPTRNKTRTVAHLPLKGLAAGLLLGIGVITGWFGNAQFSGNARVALDGTAIHLNTVAADHANLLLHISTNDPARMEAALNYAEEQLAAHRAKNRAFRLEVVANDGGLDLLRRDTSPYPERIEALLSEYDNVTFLACANALRKLRSQGVNVELLPGTRSDHTALDEIIERLDNGWRYIKA